MQAFVTTARDNPRVLRMSRQIGTVEPGKLADLIAVDIDPLSCPGLLADPANVQGRPQSRPQREGPAMTGANASVIRRDRSARWCTGEGYLT